MGRPVDMELREVWRERFARQAASGASVAEFCREEEVSEASYYGWRKRLAREVGAKRRGRSDARGSTDPRMRREEPEVHFIQLPLSTLPRPAAVEITLTNGALIRVPCDGGELLERVLRMVFCHEPHGSEEVRHD